MRNLQAFSLQHAFSERVTYPSMYLIQMGNCRQRFNSDPEELSARFVGSPVRSRVRAKTGWIAGASALSGVLETRDGHQRLFTILMNYNPARGGLNRQLKSLQERMVEAMDHLSAGDQPEPPARDQAAPPSYATAHAPVP